MQNLRAIGQFFMEIVHLKNWGIQKVLSRMQLVCLSSHWQCLVCICWCFTPASHFKAIGQLVMEILHFKDLGDTASVVTNAVILVLGECQISTPPYLWGISTLLWNCSTIYWELTMLYHFKVIADGQTHTQPQYNSFATVSRIN